MHSSADNFGPFTERFRLAVEAGIKELPERGTTGLELEWNLLDSRFRPLQVIGAGEEQQSFVDLLREKYLPDWLSDRHQLEVFHWMIEWATHPYYSPVATIYEARLLEACLLNAMSKAGRDFSQQLYLHHGNLLYPVAVDHRSIPRGWSLAKRRYLERCVSLYGEGLATAGLHANVSLPEPLLSWDFVHLSESERDGMHLDDYKNAVYIEGTRKMRAFAALFIATGASTPLKAEAREGEPVVVITEVDSVRNLTFPNPDTIDVPGLYRTHEDYLRLSSELVRKGIRFGNNNWTFTRARSFVEPVERVIRITSDQLHSLYRSGLYQDEGRMSLEEMAHQIEVQNLLARIDIPMARVEIRTDEGGHSMDLDIANLALKELLLLRIYADRSFADSFQYDATDLERVRRNEMEAARHGLEARILHPFSRQPLNLREFLAETLASVRPLAEKLERWEILQPLREMAKGAPNTATRMREQLRQELGEEEVVVPLSLLKEMAEAREQEVAEDVRRIASDLHRLGSEGAELQDLLIAARNEVRRDTQVPIRFRIAGGSSLTTDYSSKTEEILDLAQRMIRIPSVTNAPLERQRLAEVDRAATFIWDYLSGWGVPVELFEGGRYPAILAHFPGRLQAPVILCGHFDVVEPDPDERQFEPRIEGDYLAGRGAADMKTVVATYLIWMKDRLLQGEPFPRINLLLVGNEEIGEGEPVGTPHVLKELEDRYGYQPELLVAGERTGERGDELMGKVCTENRGLLRMEISFEGGERGHTGFREAGTDLATYLHQVQANLREVLEKHLTLNPGGGWQSQYRFPFLHFGEQGIFNVSADRAALGLEVRPVPQDSLPLLSAEIEGYCRDKGLTVRVIAAEPGIRCDPENPHLQWLLRAVERVKGSPAEIGRKLPGTSARFAPQGQGVVWGQSGIGPHSADERHYIPSIDPYYRALHALGEISIKEDTNTK